jgi:hypothetical protein
MLRERPKKLTARPGPAAKRREIAAHGLNRGN